MSGGTLHAEFSILLLKNTEQKIFIHLKTGKFYAVHFLSSLSLLLNISASINNFTLQISGDLKLFMLFNPAS